MKILKNKNLIKIGSYFLIGIIVAIFAFAGVCKAWDSFVYSSLETSLRSNVEAKRAIQKSCDASYEALLNYKKENKIELSGNGNPCTF